MSEVTLRLFGTPRLDVDGRPAQLGRRKAMALLSYLAVTRSRHHRETLATLLWPESGPEAAYSALRNVLWILRQTPLSRLLRTDRSTVELVEDDSLWSDVQRFRDLTVGCATGVHAATEACPDCVSALEEAVSLFEGPFMQGFMVTNAEGFDDWQFAEREALQRELTETLDRLTAFHTDAEDWTAVTTFARRWLRADRLNEACYRRLMFALSALGRRGEALRCYEECERILEAELGLAPEAATSDLADSIRHAEPKSEGRPTVPRRTNLPAALTPFVGREEIIGRVAGLLRGDDTRLVTLVGLGGIGKTSLAVQIGRALVDEMEHGVFLVPLGTADEDEVVASAIAQALGLSLSRDKGARLALELEDYLKERRILLILDEVEGAVTIDSLLPSLLSGAPRVRCLVTARVPLNVSGETVVSLHGLDYPPEDAPDESLGGYDAIHLLRVAERRVESASTNRKAELRAMARVARLLEGFPLGLEMAGAWRGVFSWREIGDRIASNLDFLVHTHRDVPARHRNLRAVYEQAWGLLSHEERGALARLAIFQGGFTIGAAEETAGCSPAVLATLAKRSLIRRVAPERYQVHQLLRQFSLENLRKGVGGFDEVSERHSVYYLELVERSFEKLKGPDQLATLRELQRELANIGAAWLWAAKAGRAELLRRAGHGLFFYFDIRAHFDQGARTFHEAIEHFDRHVGPAAAGFLHVAYGWFTHFTAEAEPRQWIAEGLALLDDSEPFTLDHALANVIACYAGALGSLEEVRERLGRSLEYYRATADKWGEALTTDALASAEFRVDASEGERLAEESLRLRKEIGDHWGEALNLATLGRFAESRGKWDLAKVRYHQSQRLSARIAEDLFMAISAQLARARIAGRQGEYAEGGRLAAEGLQLAKQASSRLLVARALIELGCLARGEGELPSATERLGEAFSLLEGTPWWMDAAQCARLLGQVAKASGDEEEERRWRQEARTLDPEGVTEPWTN